MLNNKIISSLIIFTPVLLLLTPRGFFYSNIVLLTVIILFFILNLIHHNKKKKKNSFFSFLFIGFLFLIINYFLNFKTISLERNEMSLIYFFLLCINIIYFNGIAYNKHQDFELVMKNIISAVFFITLITLLVYIFSNKSYFSNLEGRFNGWSQSPTTLGIYLSWFIFYALIIINDKKTLVLLYLITLIAIYYSGTRSTLMLVIIIFVLKFLNINKRKYGICSIILLLVLIFGDYIYMFLYNLGINNILGRYDSGSDDSFLTRESLKLQQISIIKNSDLPTLFFGHGSNYSNNFLNKNKALSEQILLPHNDFLRLLIDFGFLFWSWFILFFFKIFKNSKVISLVPILIYFISFYHNMAFDHYNILLLFISFILLNKTPFEKRIDKRKFILKKQEI